MPAAQHRNPRAPAFAMVAAAIALATMLAAVVVLALAGPASAAVVTGAPRQAALKIERPTSAVVTDALTAAARAEPAGNREPSQATLDACATAPSGAACIASALADIDAARAAEGIGPMNLPGSFASLTVAQQLMVATNLERIGRGMTPALGLSANLDSTAAAAAAKDADPFPSQFNGDALTSNWAGGTGSALLADFLWMYDDGPGSGNVDCRQAGDSGCWGHRDNILYLFDTPIVMGAAEVDNTPYGASITQVFVGGDTATGPGQADQPLNPTWAQLSGAAPPLAQQASASIRRAVRLTLHPSRHRLRRGAAATITGHLRASGGGSSGQLVALEARTLNGATRTVARRRTHGDGVVRFHISPRRTTVYWLVYGGSAWLLPASTRGTEVHVRRRRHR